MSEGDYIELEKNISMLLPAMEKRKARWIMHKVFEWLESNGFEVRRK